MKRKEQKKWKIKNKKWKRNKKKKRRKRKREKREKKKRKIETLIQERRCKGKATWVCNICNTHNVRNDELLKRQQRFEHNSVHSGHRRHEYALYINSGISFLVSYLCHFQPEWQTLEATGICLIKS